MRGLLTLLTALLLISVGIDRAHAQTCPTANPTEADAPSQTEWLRGRLIHHDGIRDWFELKLGRPICGQRSIQAVAGQGDWTRFARLRGCRVRSYGSLDTAGTGYYSRDLYQAIARIEPLAGCARKPAFPDFSNVQPGKLVRYYRVEMQVNYRPRDHPIRFRVFDRRRELRPWQAYASYQLTGSFVLYGLCGKGFVVDRVFGSPQARPSHLFDAREPGDMAAFDPENAAQSGKRDLHLGYSCLRAR
jgi:hypothetical protein